MKAALPSLLPALLLATGAARAQVVPATGATWAAFIPPPYQLMAGGDSLATGDLNGDGRPDVALALEDTARHGRHDWPRLLLVLLRTPAGGYRLAARSERVLRQPSRADYLGFRDVTVAIEQGLLTVNCIQWGRIGRLVTTRFRYRQGELYLTRLTDAVGVNLGSCADDGYPPGYDYCDTNFLTGRYELIRTSPTCRVTLHRRGQQPVKPLTRLADYRPTP